ncbi:Uncharacterized protein FWK35_00035684 [Aphis craccivora]|uniref:Uncharacterized protein n=1 Tax=Aphis craccivora TaxID=307492 RepID=A0A6G0W835_APHCR|nr:Uncharacterized protein FWK35_00035684 [Aphis craccivora]
MPRVEEVAYATMTMTRDIEKSISHNQEKPSESLINRQKISNRLKRKALDYPIERLSKIIHNNLRDNEKDTLNAHDFKLIRKKYVLC